MAILLLKSQERSIHGTQGCINEANPKGTEATELLRDVMLKNYSSYSQGWYHFATQTHHSA